MAWKVYEQSLKIARQIKEPTFISYVLWGLGNIACLVYEDYQSARALAEEGLSISKEIGSLGLESGHQYLLAYTFTSLEKWFEAEELFDKSIENLKKIDAQVYNIYRWAGLARLYMAQGRLDMAVQKVDLILGDEETNRIKVRGFYALDPLEACCQVLSTSNDPRFPEVLETAYNYLQNRAKKISNVDWRSSFLNNIPWNRKIREMWEAEQEENKIT